MQEIIFTLAKEHEHLDSSLYPTPASKNLPDWYKTMPTSYGEPGTLESSQTRTIKKCMPVLDTISSGYLLYLHTDLIIEKNEADVYTYHWSSDDRKVITLHTPEATNGYKNIRTPSNIAKLQNPWSIKTAKGCSTLFLPPLHRPKCGITILEGVVDTDIYTDSVQFPFMVDEGFSGIIVKGTPIAQVIPFIRQNWQMKIGGEKEQQEATRVGKFITSSFFNAYKKTYRQEKKYQ